ncbi:MAG: hypothetical protein LBC12_03650, partial [Nitrososphaerota archaeon]|nr:hypothetical protein [Nitrososphaerota archaeon]
SILYCEKFGFIILNCSQFCVSSIMFLIAILKAAALQKEGQLNYINSLTTTQLYKCVNNKKKGSSII